MKSNLSSKLLLRRVVIAVLLPVMTVFMGSQTFADNDNAILVDKKESIQRIQSVQPLSWTLTASQWEISRNGESVLSLTVLNDLVRTWLSSVQSLQNITSPHKNEIIEIQYPGGEEGEVWVQELTDWLVALGVPSRYISVIPGSAADDEIVFQLYSN